MLQHLPWFVLVVNLCDVAVAGSLTPRPQFITRPQKLSCKAADGVDFEHSIQTSNGIKSVLQILIKDNYDVTVLPPAPTTPPPILSTESPTPPTTPSLPSSITTKTTTTLPPPTRTTTLTTKTMTRSSTTTRPTTTGPSETTPVPGTFYDPLDSVVEGTDDDWDYIQGLVPRSNGDPGLLAYERLRHRLRTMMRDSEKEKKSAEMFCAEALEDDDEVIKADGSLHPKFIEVPGVGVYRLHARPRSWEEARKVCEREGAQLAVPNSRTEALALMEIHNRCPRLLPTHFNDYQYLGVHDLYSEGDWETVVGYRLNETGYVNWANNQPDNNHHHGENCLTMSRTGFFNDVPCWTEIPFICEHP